MPITPTSPITQESHTKIEAWFTTHFEEAPPSLSGNAIMVDLMQSEVGPLVIGATHEGVCLVEFTDLDRLGSQVSTLRRWLPYPAYRGDHPHLTQLRRELTDYFAGERTRFEVPLLYPGTDFQRSVWNALLNIPYGETRSYESLARQVATAEAMRAVGGANGANRIAILIPCHRVVNKNGKLGGYGGGLWRKKALLALEQQQLTLEL